MPISRKTSSLTVLSISLSGLFASAAQTADWPTWRHDEGRSGSTPQKLANELHLQWTLQAEPLTPAWPEDRRLQFDAVYEPVVVGTTMFLASGRNDSVTAVDLETARTLWRFYADGPVRLAPVVTDGRICFGSDDGQVYCLDAASGALLWRLRPLPSRKVLGNGRLISVRPVRGGPVVARGKLHFTTGVWPFEGTFLHDVPLDADAPVVESRLLDDLSPQGYLVAGGEQLFLPAGRSEVAAFDLKTGRRANLKYSSKGHTDYHAVANDRFLFHGGKVYDRKTSISYPTFARHPVIDGSLLYSSDGGVMRAIDLSKAHEVKTKNSRGRDVSKWEVGEEWRLPNEAIANKDVVERLRRTDPAEGSRKTPYQAWLGDNPLVVAIKAGDRLYGHQGSTVFALDLPTSDERLGVSWTAQVEGRPGGMIAAAQRLIVVTREGGIWCFGPGKRARTSVVFQPPAPEATEPAAAAASSLVDVDRVLEATSGREGYCVLLGLGSSSLLEGLVRRTGLHVVALETDAARVLATRRSLDRAGSYGTRVSILTERNDISRLPRYFASLVVNDGTSLADLRSGSRLGEAVLRILRPFDGVAHLRLPDVARSELVSWFDAAERPDARLVSRDGVSVLEKVDAPPGSAPWKREYGNEGNTLMSRDSLVKAPLGVLWFGGQAGSDELFYNRHNWPPSLTVVGGRMFIQGPGKLAAVDVYTGRVLWKTAIRYGGGGVEQRRNLTSVSGDRMGNPIFGTPPTGYHFLVENDALYLAYPERCLVLDPSSGKQLKELNLAQKNAEWGRIRCHGDLLIVPVLEPRDEKGEKQRLPQKLIAMDRHSGEVRWTREAEHSFPFVAMGRERVFCFDADLENLYRDRRRKNKVPKSTSDKVMVALDLETGKPIWRIEMKMIAAWLTFSEDLNVLVASNSEEIVAMHGSNGYELWRKKKKAKTFGGHPENLVHKVILWKDRVIDQRGPGYSYDLRTGADRMEDHPLSGEKVAWEFTKVGHHCNYAIASEHLLTFRAASAGYHDLLGGGTSRLEGFRSGCRNSLIPADGVLNAPNFANGCICSYSIFTSLALVHVPENEKWSYSAYRSPAGKIRTLGINLGAPGDRRSESGTLWLDFPNIGGPSPSVAIKTEPASPTRFRLHSSQIDGEGPSWVASSGLSKLSSLSIMLNATQTKKGPDETKKEPVESYTVRLHFCEPDAVVAGERVFDVSLQGEKMLEDFDVRASAGASRRGFVKAFRGVRIGKELKIDLEASTGSPVLSGVELLLETS